VIVSVIGTVTEPELEEITTLALYVPFARVPVLTETRIELGVLPLVRLTLNQVFPVWVTV
jgi:hypothetical protein